MADLEMLVRPHQTRDISPSKRPGRGSCEEGLKTVVLQFGKGGRGKLYTLSYSLSATNYMTKRQKELREDE